MLQSEDIEWLNGYKSIYIIYIYINMHTYNYTHTHTYIHAHIYTHILPVRDSFQIYRHT